LFASGKRVLDLGCGSGYGSAELARTAESVIGVDVSAEAVAYASSHYSLANLSFFRHSCTQLPWPDQGFQFITAFEVIEHLSNWQEMLNEVRRLLSPGGTFLVSTPNKLYYADQRREAGPNPFHEHEFEYEEFRQALSQYFPRVEMLLQNRSEAFVYASPDAPVIGPRIRLESSASDPTAAQFFVALCGSDVSYRPFVFLPSAGNLLRERELHISRLISEVGLKDKWLAGVTGERDQLQKQHDATLRQLEERNRWALSLEAELDEARKRVVTLQDEFAKEQESARQLAEAYEAKIGELERDVTEKTNWALETERRLTADLEAKCGELAEAVRLLDTAEATVEERTRWAQGLDAQLQSARARLSMIRSSKWVRIGRAAGVGPKLD
jgi:SAM-dependent methyltransferase